MNILERMISLIGWTVLLFMVYVAVVIGLVIREFPGVEE